MLRLQRFFNALIILTLSGILLSAFGVQLFLHEVPCPLCLLQRLGMFGVACGAMLNVRYNIRMSHYGLILLSSLFGGFVAIRQISLHVCPGTPAFGLPVLGLSLYTWSFIIFACCVLAVALLLLLYNPKEPAESTPPMEWWGKLAFILILTLALANVLTTFIQCGFGPCAD